MKYFLFAGATFYAAGGAKDFITSSEDLEYLIEYAKELLYGEKEKMGWYVHDWYHITDENMKIIVQHGEAHC